jgi:hypothetical protein
MKQRVDDQLMAGESVRWHKTALRTIGPVTAAGHLYLTQHRLLFIANGVNLRRRLPWSVSLEHVREVEVKARTGTPFNGGMRRRLAVRLDGNVEELFIVNKVDLVRDSLRHLIFDEVSAHN